WGSSCGRISRTPSLPSQLSDRSPHVSQDAPSQHAYRNSIPAVSCSAALQSFARYSRAAQCDLRKSRIGDSIGVMLRGVWACVWIGAAGLHQVNQAVFAPPAAAILFRIFTPGMSYSSNTTPRALSSATSRSTSSTCQNAWLAREVPAFGVGYRKHAV